MTWRNLCYSAKIKFANPILYFIYEQLEIKIKKNAWRKHQQKIPLGAIGLDSSYETPLNLLKHENGVTQKVKCQTKHCNNKIMKKKKSS